MPDSMPGTVQVPALCQARSKLSQSHREEGKLAVGSAIRKNGEVEGKVSHGDLLCAKELATPGGKGHVDFLELTACAEVKQIHKYPQRLRPAQASPGLFSGE